MNPFSAVLPGGRASTSAFILGLLVLAALDAGRLAYGIAPNMTSVTFFAGVPIWFAVLFLHMNRLRDAGRSVGMAFAPVLLGSALKAVGGLIGWLYGLVIAIAAYLSRDGGAVSDDDLMQAVQDERFIQEFNQIWPQDPELYQLVLQGGAMPGFVGFWLVILGFSFWFAGMKRTGGSL